MARLPRKVRTTKYKPYWDALAYSTLSWKVKELGFTVHFNINLVQGCICIIAGARDQEKNGELVRNFSALRSRFQAIGAEVNFEARLSGFYLCFDYKIPMAIASKSVKVALFFLQACEILGIPAPLGLIVEHQYDVRVWVANDGISCWTTEGSALLEIAKREMAAAKSVA